jgi:hypothetical protein
MKDIQITLTDPILHHVKSIKKHLAANGQTVSESFIIDTIIRIHMEENTIIESAAQSIFRHLR